jgi:UDP-sugar transporter A1/2/3
VLLNELLKGAISLAIACASMSQSQYEQMSLTGAKVGSPWSFGRLMQRFRRLENEVFSPDCWKLSIPAILYGGDSTVLSMTDSNYLCSHPK